jgi:hypothetical protein
LTGREEQELLGEREREDKKAALQKIDRRG